MELTGLIKQLARRLPTRHEKGLRHGGFASGALVVGALLSPMIAISGDTTANTVQGRLLFTGENWEGNAPSRSGERWLALRHDRGSWTLSEVEVLISRAPERSMRPLMVSIQGTPTPKFLIRGVPELKPSRVTAWFDGELFLSRGTTLYLPQTERHYEVGISTVDRRATVIPNGSRWTTYEIVLFDNSRKAKQALVRAFVNQGQTPSLLWAGDLDHDGRVDLLLDVETTEAAGSTYHLYLSSRAKAGELVGLAATLRNAAC